MHRFDISLEADLIEEIARIHGYDAIPETAAAAQTRLETVTESIIELDAIAATLIARDYQEVVTYSFVDADLDAAISGSASNLSLSNPISSEMSVMRASLWPGMLESAAANLARQQERVRIFEHGKSFHGSLDSPVEIDRIAAVAIGPRYPEQWGAKSQPVDFFDIKSDVEALLAMAGDDAEIEFVAAEIPSLQPGQTAELRRNGELIGVVGKLHPRVAKRFGLKPAVYLFEVNAEQALSSRVPSAETVSKFPGIRRDIAVVVKDAVTSDELVRAVASASPRLIRSVRIFDVYKGPGIEAGLKSVAIGLILQETSRTLTDDDADAAQAAAVQKLQQEFAAELRD